jgi:hypothetical protein
MGVAVGLAKGVAVAAGFKSAVKAKTLPMMITSTTIATAITYVLFIY